MVPVARQARLPLLAHLHAPYLRRDRFGLLLHQVTLAVGVSRYVLQGLADDGMAQEKLLVIHNGIDTATLDVPPVSRTRDVLGIPAGALLITCIGSLHKRKGQDVLLRAAVLLPAEPPAHLLLVSDGPERDMLVQLSVELGLSGRVHFVPFVGRGELSAIYRATDVFALASRQEAFGLVLAEAGYFEVPVVATAVGGVPDVVEDGVTGLCVPAEDPDALAAALRRLLADPAERQRMGRAAKARVLQRFTADRMVADLQGRYDKILTGGSSRGWLASLGALRPYLRLLACRWSR
jgi:glycosyltransferase involved in cell wall biosynthesis